MTNEEREEIRTLRRKEGMAITAIAKKFSITPQAVTKALLPDNYKIHDLVECECCGQMFDAKSNGAYHLTCSISCSKQMDSYYKRIAMGLECEHPRNWTKSENDKSWSHETIGHVSRVWDDFLEMFIFIEEPESQKRIKEIVNAADKAKKTYGVYVREDEYKRAAEAGCSVDKLVDREFQEYIHTAHRENYNVGIM